MPPTVETRSGRYTLAAARASEANVLAAVDDARQLQALLAALWDRRDALAATAKSHLGLGWRDACRVLPVEAWACDRFDTSVVVEVQRGAKAVGGQQSGVTSEYVLRVYMPHTLPGTVDEKLCCDVAAHAWVEEHCADAIRTPALIGFGLAGGGPRFTHVRYLSWHARLLRHVRKYVRRLLARPLLTNYQRCPGGDADIGGGFGYGYLLLEHIGPETGQPLSATWQQETTASDHQHLRRLNLHRSISRALLALARLPQPRIGSFAFDPADGTVRLRNRPLLPVTLQLEAAAGGADGAARIIPPAQTYARADVFAADLLALHDRHWLADRHAVRDAQDARQRLAVRTLWRAVASLYTRTQTQTQFLPQLDLPLASLVVDHDWNVTCVRRLDGLAALPAAALAVPHWLTGCSHLHQLRGERYDAYDAARRVFLEVMRQDDTHSGSAAAPAIAQILEDSWQSRAVWFWASLLRSTSAWLPLFEDHMLPYFAPPGTSVAQLAGAGVAAFWAADIDGVVAKKLDDEAQYQADLQQLFEQAKAE